jgi:hypothetical protein
VGGIGSKINTKPQKIREDLATIWNGTYDSRARMEERTID